MPKQEVIIILFAIDNSTIYIVVVLSTIRDKSFILQQVTTWFFTNKGFPFLLALTAMCLIREVATIIVTVTKPFNSYAYTCTVTHGPVLRFVTGPGAAGFVFCLGAVWRAVASLLNFNTGAGYLKDDCCRYINDKPA